MYLQLPALIVVFCGWTNYWTFAAQFIFIVGLSVIRMHMSGN